MNFLKPLQKSLPKRNLYFANNMIALISTFYFKLTLDFQKNYNNPELPYTPYPVDANLADSNNYLCVL